jgi:hypothetical protein
VTVRVEFPTVQQRPGNGFGIEAQMQAARLTALTITLTIPGEEDEDDREAMYAALFGGADFS